MQRIRSYTFVSAYYQAGASSVNYASNTKKKHEVAKRILLFWSMCVIILFCDRNFSLPPLYMHPVSCLMGTYN